MSAVTVVLDINGVLADVRRREAPPVSRRKPDVVLPNRQKAYMHPCCAIFLQWLCDSRVPVVLFTSRTSRNAAPLESAMARLCPAFKPVYTMHGEDCEGSCCPEESWRPMKSADMVVRALRWPSETTKHLLFVDDHPDRIKLGDARVVGVSSYNAATQSDQQAEQSMKDTMWDIRDTITSLPEK